MLIYEHKTAEMLDQFWITTVIQRPLHIHPASCAYFPGFRCERNQPHRHPHLPRAFWWHFQGISGAFHGHCLGFSVAIFRPGFAPILTTIWPLCGQKSRVLFCLSAAAGCIGHRLRPVRGGTGYAGRDGSCVTPSYALFCFTAVAETVEVSRGGFLPLHCLQTGDLQGKISRLKL